MALVHLESTMPQADSEAFEEARKTGGKWGGPVEKNYFFLYWNYTKRLAKAMPEIPQTIASNQRETNPIYAITSKESAS